MILLAFTLFDVILTMRFYPGPHSLLLLKKEYAVINLVIYLHSTEIYEFCFTCYMANIDLLARIKEG